MSRSLQRLTNMFTVLVLFVLHFLASSGEYLGPFPLPALSEINLESGKIHNLGTRSSIDVTFDPALLGPEFDAARAVVQKACLIWESVLHHSYPIPVTVIPAQIGIFSSFSTSLYYGDWPTIIAYLSTYDPDPFTNWPTSTSEINETLHYKSDQSWNGEVLVAAAWASPLYSQALGFTLGIDPNVISNYDLDSSDGIAYDKYDALTSVLYAIGRALGFNTKVDGPGPGPDRIFAMDLFRFASSETEDLKLAHREFDPAAPHHWFKGVHTDKAVELSRGGSVPASGWLDAEKSSQIMGVMDTKEEHGRPVGISPYDIAAIDSMGYVVNTAFDLIVDGVYGLNQTTRKVKVMGFFIEKGAKCRFNDLASLTVASEDDVPNNAWRAVSCVIPSSLKIGAQDISVSLSNDGKEFSPSFPFSWAAPLIRGVSPRNLPLINFNSSIKARGRLFSMDPTVKYQCSVAGATFPAIVTSNTKLDCNLTFTSASSPIAMNAYNLTIIQGKYRSSPFVVHFVYPPVITSGKMDSQKVRLEGSRFEPGVCEFSSGDTKQSVLTANGLTCDAVRVSTPTVNVRVSSKSGWSNWYTLKVPK